jgi:D-alanine-D-alanine ligase
VVKPNSLGSSDGVTIVRQGDDFRAAVEAAFELDDTVLVEEFIQGVEVTGAVLGNVELEALPLVEIVPSSGFYDRHDKYTPGATDEICPARLSDDLTSSCQEAALRCHRALGCRGVSRTDMLVTRDGLVYTLEVNTIPGMTPTSLVPRSAGVAGYSFSQLMDKLIALALDKQ